MRVSLPALSACAAVLVACAPLLASESDSDSIGSQFTLGQPVSGIQIQTRQQEEPDTIIIGEDPPVVGEDGDVQFTLEDEHADDHGLAHRPDGHAPAGLMGDHVHKQGEVMFEYRFAYMNMQGMRQGTDSVTAQQAIAGAGTVASPKDMNMTMHMGHLMYGLSDDVTLYTMFMWNELGMDHVTGGNVVFRTENSDFDDMVVGALFNLHKDCNSQWIGNLGISLPTGDIGQQVTTGPPPPPGSYFPYPMRTGAGTVNIRPALTYKTWNDCGSFGVQTQAIIPLHENYRDYSEGTEVFVTAWKAWLLSEHLSGSLRIEGLWRDNFHGADPQLPQGLVTTNRPDFQGRSNVNLYGGLNSIFNGHRFAIEVGTPVYQNVRGYQLEQDFFLFTSWSKVF